MSKKEFLKRLGLWLFIGVVASLASHFLIEIFLYLGFKYEYVWNLIINGREILFLLGSGILFIFYILFSSLFGSSLIGGTLLIAMTWILGVATRYKRYFREEPIFPNEFYMITELPFFIEMIGWPRVIMLVFILTSILFLLFFYYKNRIKPKKSEKFRKTEIILRLSGIILSISSIIYISNFNYENNKVNEVYSDYTNWSYHNQLKNYMDNGFIAGFLSNLDAPPMNSPKNYSKKSMEHLFDKYNEASTKINQERNRTNTKTNVIFVMNESFSDPYNLKGIESNKDPLPYYRVIIDNALSGKTLSPTYGGGTATNEFQALTGFSMEPMNPQITSPYIQLINGIGSYPSIVKQMNRLGHQTTAIHPYNSTFYRRNVLYEDMGFDDFLHQENMNNREKISDKHPYISDYSAYKEVFEVLEKTQEPDFVHLVTMQNHTPFADKYENVKFKVSGSGNPEEANGYFQDLENADISLRLFINKIQDYSEPILLVFWGDHLPGLYRGEVREENSEITLRETPLIIYSNQTDLAGEVQLISPLYLNTYVTEILGLKTSPYGALISTLFERIPVLDNEIYKESHSEEIVNSRSLLSKPTLEILEDYTLLMYDITTGNQYAHELGFFEE